jgi:hypothetical protein
VRRSIINEKNVVDPGLQKRMHGIAYAKLQ